MKHIFLGLIVLLVAACSAETASDGPSGIEGHDPTPMDFVKISRGPCFGACPVFDLTLYGDGRLMFHGARFTKVKGQETRQASTGRFLEAISALEARGFDTLPDKFDRDSCKVWATDHPSVTIEMRLGDKKKSFNWYTGCRGLEARAQIERMVAELERILDVEGFVGNGK